MQTEFVTFYVVKDSHDRPLNILVCEYGPIWYVNQMLVNRNPIPQTHTCSNALNVVLTVSDNKNIIRRQV